MDKIKSLLMQLGEKVTVLAQKVAPSLKSFGAKTAAFFRKPKNAIIVGAGAVLLAAACVIIWFAVNVWSWATLTLSMPEDVYAASLVSVSDVISGGDVSDSDVSGSDVSASDAVSGADIVSSSDTVSGSDMVSGSDTVSGSDAAELPEIVTLRVKKGTTLSAALEQLNIVLDQSLSIDTPVDTAIEDDITVNIYRMMYVTVIADGGQVSRYTGQETVGLLLEEAGIALGENDRISCTVDAPVENNMVITINRVAIVEEVKSEVVPFATEKRENASVNQGKTTVITAGVNGSKDVTYRCVYVDGILESSEAIGEVITLQPVNEVIEYGTKRTTTTTRRTNAGKYVVSKEKVYDCDGSGHGYYIITYSDGSVVYQDF